MRPQKNDYNIEFKKVIDKREEERKKTNLT